MPPSENRDDILVGLYGLALDDDGGASGRPSPVPLVGVDVQVRDEGSSFVLDCEHKECHNSHGSILFENPLPVRCGRRKRWTLYPR